MAEKKSQVAADQLHHPRSRAPNGFHASIVTRADLLRDDVLANRVREVRAAVDSRFKDATVHVFRLEDFKDLIKYSLEELDWQIFHDVARDVFWGYRRVDHEPIFFRPSIALLLEDINETIKESKWASLQTLLADLKSESPSEETRGHFEVSKQTALAMAKRLQSEKGARPPVAVESWHDIVCLVWGAGLVSKAPLAYGCFRGIHTVFTDNGSTQNLFDSIEKAAEEVCRLLKTSSK